MPTVCTYLTNIQDWFSLKSGQRSGSMIVWDHPFLVILRPCVLLKLHLRLFLCLWAQCGNLFVWTPMTCLCFPDLLPSLSLLSHHAVRPFHMFLLFTAFSHPLGAPTTLEVVSAMVWPHGSEWTADVLYLSGSQSHAFGVTHLVRAHPWGNLVHMNMMVYPGKWSEGDWAGWWSFWQCYLNCE